MRRRRDPLRIDSWREAIASSFRPIRSASRASANWASAPLRGTGAGGTGLGSPAARGLSREISRSRTSSTSSGAVKWKPATYPSTRPSGPTITKVGRAITP